MPDPLVIRTLPDEGAKEIAHRIRQLAPNLTCTGCAKRDFALLEQPDADSRSIFVRRNMSEGLMARYESAEATHTVSTLVCTTCGKLEQFSDGVVLKYAKPDEWGQAVEESARS